MSLPTDPKARKGVPLFSGVLKYFPDALAAVARCSQAGNDQHNPGKPLHWDRSKSGDEADALLRHLADYAAGMPMDSDNVPHLAKVAWRALALLQKDVEATRARESTALALLAAKPLPGLITPLEPAPPHREPPEDDG